MCIQYTLIYIHPYSALSIPPNTAPSQLHVPLKKIHKLLIGAAHRCGTIHWDMGNLLMTMFPKKSDSHLPAAINWQKLLLSQALRAPPQSMLEFLTGLTLS